MTEKTKRTRRAAGKPPHTYVSMSRAPFMAVGRELRKKEHADLKWVAEKLDRMEVYLVRRTQGKDGRIFLNIKVIDPELALGPANFWLSVNEADGTVPVSSYSERLRSRLGLSRAGLDIVLGAVAEWALNDAKLHKRELPLMLAKTAAVRKVDMEDLI